MTCAVRVSCGLTTLAGRSYIGSSAALWLQFRLHLMISESSARLPPSPPFHTRMCTHILSSKMTEGTELEVHLNQIQGGQLPAEGSEPA